MLKIQFQMGYKDGVYDGRESQFQNGFDVGYEHGFQNGYVLGKYKGSLTVVQNKSTETSSNAVNSPLQNDFILQRSSRGQCILCTNPSLKDNSISDIVDKQTDHLRRIETTLTSRYGAN